MLSIKSAPVTGMCLLAGALLLAGCQSSAETARINAENDRRRCEDYGFKAGSEALAKCRYDLDQRRDDERDAMLNRPIGPMFVPGPGACWNTPWGWRCDPW